MSRDPTSADALAEAVIERVGRRVVLGLPVGLGKALHVANALFRRAVDDPAVHLTIFTGLTLTRPQAHNELERRFLEPLARRLYDNWPVVDYAEAVASGRLPANIEVREFYLRPGAYLGNPLAQQAYTSINYSRVASELLELGVNVIGQLVAADPARPGMLSLGSNPEVTLDLLPRMRARAAEVPCALVGQVNTALPYMGGDAEMAADDFDFLLTGPAIDHPLFPLPNRRVSAADYAAGMHVASLVPDGGTLQVGIGSMSDAVAHCLRVRHRQPAVFRELLARLPGGTAAPRRHRLPVYDAPFDEGLYCCTELMSDAVFALFTDGIVRRPADADDPACVHAGFFIGSGALYAGLKALPPERRRQIAMTRISFVNTLYGAEARKRQQRRKACFVNETMMVTLLGSAVSDALGDGRVVSGIGGQFDFVAMAAALEDARSLLMLRAWRKNKGKPESNIRWNYPHTSVPRQHRDVYVSEYGIADTRGRPDAAVIEAVLGIADARFQPGLAAEAVRAGKLPRDFRLDAGVADNRPESLAAAFEPPAIARHFPPYPLGTDLDGDEQALAEALGWLANATAGRAGRLATALRAGLAPLRAENHAALDRMGLAGSSGSWLQRRLVNLALEETR